MAGLAAGGAIATDGFVERVWPFSDYVCDLDGLPAGWEVPGPLACLHLSGLAQIGDRIYGSARELTEALASGRIGVSDLAEGLGFYTAVVRSGEEVLFLNDLMGLEHIYVYESDRIHLVGNRIHALSRRLSLAGARRRPDLIYAATTLSSHHPLFRQAHAHRLSLAGLSLVPFDQYLVWRKGRLERRRKRVLEDAFANAGGGSSYARLIDDAAEELIRSVRVVRDSGLFDHISMDLSGGRDSRVMLAAIIRAGCLADTPINTRDVSGSDDLRCAQRLVAHYGARHFTGDGHAASLVDTAEAMTLWRSHFGGMYHKMRGMPRSALGGNVRSVRFTGYCGEIYRSFWGKLLPEIEDERTATAGLARMFNDLAPDLPKALQKDAVDAFIATILDLPGATVRQKLDNHYLYFRNRTHFGMRSYHTFQQFVRWPALVSPSLLKASRMLPEREARRGKAIFDVVDRMMPELNFFAYTNKPWPEFIASASPHYARCRSIDATLPEDFDRDGWRAAQESAGEEHLQDDVRWHFRFRDHAREEMRRGVAQIEDTMPELASLMGEDYGAGLDQLFEGADPWYWRVAASKVCSLVDTLIAGPSPAIDPTRR